MSPLNLRGLSAGRDFGEGRSAVEHAELNAAPRSVEDDVAGESLERGVGIVVREGDDRGSGDCRQTSPRRSVTGPGTVRDCPELWATPRCAWVASC